MGSRKENYICNEAMEMRRLLIKLPELEDANLNNHKHRLSNFIFIQNKNNEGAITEHSIVGLCLKCKKQFVDFNIIDPSPNYNALWWWLKKSNLFLGISENDIVLYYEHYDNGAPLIRGTLGGWAL